jgi:hypothetical protein
VACFDQRVDGFGSASNTVLMIFDLFRNPYDHIVPMLEPFGVQPCVQLFVRVEWRLF